MRSALLVALVVVCGTYVWARGSDQRALVAREEALVDGTPMVSPADLVRSGKLVRVVDELHP